MAYDSNRFCWYGLLTDDPERAVAFYCDALGWTSETVQMGDETVTMLIAGGAPFAHVRACTEGESVGWTHYLRVEDVEAAVAAAQKAGGAEVIGPTDIAPGRFAAIRGPGGGVLRVFREKDADAQHHPGGVVSWIELHSTRVADDVAWLKTVFGFDVGEMPMGDTGGTYYLLRVDDEMRAGACPAVLPDPVSEWMVWFETADADAALARMEAAGGSAFGELRDYPGVGRMGLIADPSGAHFGIITSLKP